MADTTAPSAPTSLAASINGTGVNLSWSPAIDDVGVASYEVDRDGHAITTGLHATSMTDTGAAPGTHSYTVRAVDPSGNVGAFSAPLTVVVVGPAALPTVKAARVKTVTTLRLQRLGKHRVLRLLEGAARRTPLPGATRGEARSPARGRPEGAVRGRQGASGQAHQEALRGAGRSVVLSVRRA